MARLAEPTQMVFEDLTPASTRAEVLVEELLRPQKRFAHLFAKEGAPFSLRSSCRLMTTERS